MSLESDIDPERLGRAVTMRRSLLGQRRKWLAEASGLSYPYIAEIENGGKVPSHKAMTAIANALGWSLTELIDAANEIPGTTEAFETGPMRRSSGGYPDRESSLFLSTSRGPKGDAMDDLRSEMQMLALRVDRLDSEVRELRYELKRRMAE